ncbi:site-2 protease family protein [Tepidibacillus marianensis]|uniref:site-2 protease family protein n=1 Tax=Tepidibacillus marianensis TaxID=3131995 RepID=UPI0030D2798A
MSQFLYYPISELPYVIAALLIAFTVHEFSHAYVAYKFGDPTAKEQGRLTLNPAAHLDLFGTLLIFIAGFGWAKPVPVDPNHFKNRKYAGALISIAGPISNLLIAILFIVLYFGMYRVGILSHLTESTNEIISHFIDIIVSLNIVLFVFNLVPLPPLDGYRVIEDLAPTGVRAKLSQYEYYGSFIFLILFITPLGDYIFGPIFNTVVPFVLDTLVNVFGTVFRL